MSSSDAAAIIDLTDRSSVEGGANMSAGSSLVSPLPVYHNNKDKNNSKYNDKNEVWVDVETDNYNGHKIHDKNDIGKKRKYDSVTITSDKGGGGKGAKGKKPKTTMKVLPIMSFFTRK